MKREGRKKGTKVEEKQREQREREKEVEGRK
jgi:hypothetical protein